VPADRQLAENLARELVTIYGAAAERMAIDVARRLDTDLQGIQRPDWAERRLLALEALHEQANRLTARLTSETAEAVEQMTVLAAQRGGAEALRELGRLGFAPATTASIRRELPGAEAVQRLTYSLTSTLQGTHLRITRWPLDVYREVTSRAAAGILLGLDARRAAAQRIWGDLVGRGITGFVDRSGRAWSLEAYVDMASRTVAAQAAVEAHLDRLGEAGLDLVIVSDAPQECEICRDWEGMVLDQSGGPARVETRQHATDATATVEVKIAGSVDNAIADGLMHPNCRHSLSAYLPGVTVQPTNTADPDGDAARQKLRRLEREIRRQKLKAETALTPQARAAAAARVRDLQGQIRDHVKQTGVFRQRYREQLHLGNVPPPSGGPLPTAPDLPPPGPLGPGEMMRTADLRRMSDDQLDELFGDLSALDNLPAGDLQRVADEMDRRERTLAALQARQRPAAAPADEDWLTGADGANAGEAYEWPAPDELTGEQRQLDDLIDRGWSYTEAYAEVYGVDARQLARQEGGAAVHRRAGETIDQAVARAYDEWVHTEYLSAEEWTRGHMLTAEGQAAGIDPRELWSGNLTRARRYASEELLRYWAEHRRLNKTEFRAHILGRAKDIRAAEVTRFQSQGQDFI
jgi:hypothetical protein